jgi:cytochrome c
VARLSARRGSLAGRRGTGRVTRRLLVAVGLWAAACAPAWSAAFHVLVFTKTAGFRHDSIPRGIGLIHALGAANGFAVDTTDDASRFNRKALRSYRVVVFLNTTGDVLGQKQQAVLEAFVRRGGGWVGVHAAADTEYDWPFYGMLLGGARFRDHPQIQEATIEVERAAHPSTRHLPATFSFTDEWYNFASNPRGSAQVLLSIDESSYDPGAGAMGDHPVAWCQLVGNGRAWYTNLGHRVETYDDPSFARHLLGGIRWAAGVTAKAVSGSLPGDRPPR